MLELGVLPLRLFLPVEWKPILDQTWVLDISDIMLAGMMGDRIMINSPIRIQWCERGRMLPRETRQTEIITALYNF